MWYCDTDVIQTGLKAYLNTVKWIQNKTFNVIFKTKQIIDKTWTRTPLYPCHNVIFPEKAWCTRTTVCVCEIMPCHIQCDKRYPYTYTPLYRHMFWHVSVGIELFYFPLRGKCTWLHFYFTLGSSLHLRVRALLKADEHYHPSCKGI